MASIDILGGDFFVSTRFGHCALFSEVEDQSSLDETVGTNFDCFLRTSFGALLGTGVFLY